jgi:ATP-dependent protease ClpP protease subunit
MDTISIEKMFNDDKQESIYLNESTNSIYFNAGITPRTMSILIDKLLGLEQKILKKQKTLKRKFKEIKKDEDNDLEEQFDVKIEPKPIILYITSNGGYVYQVFSAIDTIRGMKIPVHTVCKGFVASAGTLLSLAGKRRYITESSYMLIHELRAGHWGKYTNLSESFENCKQLMEHIKLDIFVKHVKLRG